MDFAEEIAENGIGQSVGNHGNSQGSYGGPQGNYSGPQGNYGAQQGNYGAPQGFNGQGGMQGPGKKGLPQFVIVIAAVIALVILVGLVFIVAKDNISTALSGTPLAALTGGSGSSNVKIPSGAKPVTNATIADLAGNYEGKMNFTVFSGLEDIPDAKDKKEEIDKVVNQVLSTSYDCNLNIDEYGNWELDIEAIGMEAKSSDFKVKDPKNEEEETSHLIKDIKNGAYSLSYSEKTELNDATAGSGEGYGTAVHKGVYCEKDGENLIAGLIDMGLDAYGSKVKLSADYEVYKVDGEIPEIAGVEKSSEKTDLEDSDSKESGSADSDSAGSSQEVGAEEDSEELAEETDSDRDLPSVISPGDEEDEGESGSSNPASSKSGSSEYDMLGNGDPSETALTGGTWEQLQSGEFLYYDKSGQPVKDCWAEDEGGYYYIGPDGCLVRNNYSTDGFWADQNGCWDSSVERLDKSYMPLNQNYIGDTLTFDMFMKNEDGGNARWYYTFSTGGTTTKYDMDVERIGFSSYAARDLKKDHLIYLITVVDEGYTIIVSSAGTTEECKTFRD